MRGMARLYPHAHSTGLGNVAVCYVQVPIFYWCYICCALLVAPRSPYWFLVAGNTYLNSEIGMLNFTICPPSLILPITAADTRLAPQAARLTRIVHPGSKPWRSTQVPTATHGTI